MNQEAQSQVAVTPSPSQTAPISRSTEKTMNTINHPVIAFMEAIGAKAVHARIDFSQVGESILDDLYPDIAAVERPSRVTNITVKVGAGEALADISRASQVGAEITVIPSDDESRWVTAKAELGTFPTSGLAGGPDIIIQESPLTETAMWKVEKTDLKTLRDLSVRLANHFGSDPYFDGLDTASPLPGLRRTVSGADGEGFTPRMITLFPTNAGGRRASDITKHLEALPRTTTKDRQNTIWEVVQLDAPLSRRCETSVEAETLLFDIKEICLMKGFSETDTLYFLLHWMRQQPLDVQFTQDACISAFYRDEERKAKEDGRPDEMGRKGLFSLRSARPDYFIDQEPQPKKWVIENCLPSGKAGLLAARGGTGKSFFALQLAICVATKTNLQPWEISSARKVVYLAAEDDEEELHRRFHAICNAIAANHSAPDEFKKSLRANMLIKSMVGADNRMTSDDFGREVVPTDFVDRFLHTVAGYGRLGLIIIDPASRFRGGDENRASDATRFVEALERLAKSTGATVLVIHHVNKWSGRETEQMQEAARGSSAFTDGVRWQMNLAVMTQAEAKEYGIADDERSLYVSATVTKNNYAPPQPKVIFRRGEGGVLSNVQLVSNKQKVAEDLTSRTIELLRNECKRGALYSKSGFEAEFGGLGNVLDVGRVALRKLLDELIKCGKLVVHSGKLALPGNLIPRAKLTDGTLS